MNDEGTEVTHIQTTPRKFIYAWLATFVCCITVAVLSVQYANYVDRRSNARWCGVVTIMDDVYSTTPPQSPAGQRLAVEMERLRKQFNCKPRTL